MDYNEAYKQFSTTYTGMSKRLEEWVNYQGGKIDAEGMVQGLTDKLLIRYNQLNDDLASMLEFVQAVEGDRKEKLGEIELLKTRCRMLETAANASQYTDEYLKQEIAFHLKWTVTSDTTISDLRKLLKNRVFILDLAIKRGLLEQTDDIKKLMDNSVILLSDEDELKKAYKNRLEKLTKSLKEKKDELEKESVIDNNEHIKNLAKPA